MDGVWKKLLIVCLVSQVVLAGCAAKRTTDTTPSTGGPGTTTTTPSDRSPLATQFTPPYPGDYKTTLVDGVEYRQGRFPQGTYGGTLVLSMIASDPKTFNPWVSNDTQSGRMGSIMFPSLMDVDPYTGKVIPGLAAEFKVDPDHVTYTTRLRRGLKWSDGKPITAEDVAFTFNTIIGQGYGNSSSRDVIMVDGVMPKCTVVDELTNKFVTPKPFAPFLRTVSGLQPAPKHIIEPIISAKGGRQKFDQLWSGGTINPKDLVTSGAFVLSRSVPSQRVELVRTKNFYMLDPAGKQLPYLNRIVYQFVPEVNTNLIKFKAKEIDVSQLRNKDATNLVKDQEALNFRLYNIGQDAGTTFFMMNMNQRKDKKGKPYVNPTKAAWFNDVNFRQAINHALNRDRMVQGYFKGIGTPQFWSEPPVSLFHNKNLKAFNSDYNYSMELLKKSGFQKKSDGFLYDSKGNKVEFDMFGAAGGTMIPAIAGYIQRDLKELGMKVNFQEVEFNSLLDRVNNSKNWDSGIFALTGDPFEPNGGANVWKSTGRLHLFDQRDLDDKGNIAAPDARPWEKRIDELFSQGAVEFDEGKRRKIYDEVQQIVYEQAPFIYLVSPMNIMGARNTVKNYQPTNLTSTVSGLHNLEEIYMTGTAAPSSGATPPAGGQARP